MVCARIDFILAAMASSCMTPQEIASAAGVSVGQVYRMRKGYLIKLDAFGKICRTLGCDPALVIDYERLERAGKKAD